MPRIQVIDAIRFLAAVVVVLHHGPVPPMIEAPIFRETFFGSAAVIVFFVVSGFCIHAPLVGVSEVDWPAYFIRRYVRILVPIIVIVPLGALFDVSYNPFTGWVTWSLIAEMVYYSVYPILRAARLRFGWPPVIAISFLAAYVSLAIWAQSESHWLRIQSDVISGLPSWLLGCAVAESIRTASPAIWIKRTVVIVGSIAVAHLHYSWGLRFNWTLPIFSIAIASWLREEIARGPEGRTILSRAGEWSYSLYLVHPLAIYGIAPLLWATTTNRGWFATVLLAGLLSYGFFLAVERPSHQLARRLIKQRARAIPAA